MPLNPIEQLLSDTADYFEAHFNNVDQAEAQALLDQGNSPGVTRELSACPGFAVSIVVSKSLA